MNRERYNFRFLFLLSVFLWIGALVLFAWTRLEWRSGSSDTLVFSFVLAVYLGISLFFTWLTIRSYKQLHRPGK